MMAVAPVLVLVHGWAFDPQLWQPLRRALPEIECRAVDLGFFGEPAAPELPVDRPVVAVGHSLGVLWLLHQRPFPWAGLVSINGFPRFTEAPDFAPAVAPRLLDRMITRCRREPEAVAADFRRRCGTMAPMPAGVEAARLLAGLEWLRDWDARGGEGGRGDGRGGAPVAPSLTLAGGQDAIVPPAMTGMAFGPAVQWRADGGHLLPLSHPDWCAGHIRAFLATLVS